MKLIHPRLLAALALVGSSATIAHADFDETFDAVAAGDGPGSPWIVDGAVEATALPGGGGTALRLRSENNDSSATARRPIGMDAGEKDWTASVDWRPGDWSKPGVVLELTQQNANSRLFRLTTLSGKNSFRASNFAGGSEADIVIGDDYKKDFWYRVTASGTLGEENYQVQITERGRDNAAESAVVFDSADGDPLVVNPAVEKPHLMGFGTWQGQGPTGYQIDVDNASFTSGAAAGGDAPADAPAEPE